jgi:hypothetical protein
VVGRLYDQKQVVEELVLPSHLGEVKEEDEE